MLNNTSDNISDTNSLLKNKRTNSLLEYILKHRHDVLEKLQLSQYEKFKPNREELLQLNSNSDNIELKTIPDNVNNLNETNETNEINDINNPEQEKHKNYYNSIKWYFIYMLYGFFGGIIINSITQNSLLRYDMFFNILISPIIYYHSPKNILTNIKLKDFFKYYTLPFLVGLCFRLLDKIQSLNTFILNPKYIESKLQIALTIILIIFILITSIYYLIISSNPFTNIVLLVMELILIISFNIYYLNNGGNIHIHHYFLGLIMMLVSRNYKSKIVIILHAISYAIYIEGISKWGFDKIFWND
jgi:hypothetical protein